MKVRLAIALAAVILLACVGVLYWRQHFTIAVSPVNLSNVQLGAAPAYRIVLHGDGILPTGERTSDRVIETAGGRRLTYSSIGCFSTSHAKQRIRELVNSAVTVREVGQSLDPSGPGGERVVLSLKSGGIVVAWRTGSELHSIQADQLDDATGYERTLFPQ
jgi:hypothetical protein